MSRRLCVCLSLLISVAGAGCAAAEAESLVLPYYAERTFTPVWMPVPHSSTKHLVSDTPFLDQNGAAFTPASVHGRVHVVSFIFTRCAAICPPLVASLKKVQRATEGADVSLVSYTVDPGHDTVAVLGAFAEARGIESSRWKLLTGSVSGVHQVARDLYFADDDGMRRSLADPNTFLHTEKVLLIDRDGHIRGIYNGTQPFEMQKLVEDIRALTSPASTR
jgi:protein SCO1/2